MYYVDSQRTVTRRDSSLIVERKLEKYKSEYDYPSSGRGLSASRFASESTTSVAVLRPKDSWEVIIPPKREESTPNTELGKSPSELTVTSRRRKSIIKPSKTKRSPSKIEDDDIMQVDPLLQSWWSAPDERAIIRFKNGNVYEGCISMKCMHGEGRFQWADGTVYLGHFKDNEMRGKGLIHWKDDTWYQGDFVGNLRHGNGLYVDSRKQRSYAGGWHYGTKHGEGVIYYSNKNSYDGEWVYNVRHGFGSREYCENSGYKGEWDRYVREGKGLMIWPNHDFYRGDWKNGVMSGYGIYIWDAYCNNTMSLPSIIAYRGLWEKGQRNGYGVLNLGLGLGSHYKGEFKKNKKHGAGKFVTNNGLILQDKNLFIDDNLGPVNSDNNENAVSVQDSKKAQPQEPLMFDICDDTVGLIYHVEQALKNIDRDAEVRYNMISDYIENNKALELDVFVVNKNPYPPEDTIFGGSHLEDLIEFEEISLQKALRCYETDLKNIYFQYATICNTEEIEFTPVLIRLYLWQFYYDCNVHDKGLTLVEIDKIFYRNPKWLARTPHNPFEKMYFWQFLHSLISVASKLYAKRQLPGTKPDTILANAFRFFMENDVLPGAGRRKGRLTNGYGSFVPFKGTYELYRSLGEPHTIRTFLCAIRHPPHNLDCPQPPIVDAPDDALPFGRNAYVFGDELTFITEQHYSSDDDVDTNLKLFNFDNLSSKAVIKIFSNIFPQVYSSNKIMNLDIEITYFEFFEAFVACAEESIRVKDEEIRWREKFSLTNEGLLPNSPVIGVKNQK